MDYAEEAAAWRAALLPSLDGWQAPWLDESWLDGNPIFSAWSPALQKGIRVLCIREDFNEFDSYEDTMGDVREFVIVCRFTPENADRATRLCTAFAAVLS